MSGRYYLCQLERTYELDWQCGLRVCLFDVETMDVLLMHFDLIRILSMWILTGRVRSA